MATLVTPGVVSPTSTTYARDRFHRSADSEDKKFIPINQNLHGCDKTKEMDDDEEIPRDDECDEEEEEDDEDDYDQRNVNSFSVDERPRNKRKNFQPRSIVSETDNAVDRRKQTCHKTDVMDLRLRDSNDDSDSDGSSSKATSDLKNYRHVKLKEDAVTATTGLLSLLSAENALNNPFGIDLSRFRSSAGSGSSTKKTSESGSVGGSDSNEFPAIPQPGEISAMKEYAEKTMRELLSIYGLNNMEMNEPITNNVDISNFTAGKILEKCDGFGLSILSQPPTPPRTPMSPTQVAKSRRSDSPQEDDDGESESLDQFRPKNYVTENSTTSKIPMILQGGIHFLSSLQENLKDSRDEDSSPPPHSSSLLEPKGHRLSSSPSRDNKNTIVIDYSKYVKKFNSSSECASSYCKDLNYREHFHCLDCSGRVFVKKEEMIRHFKWHKKRDESLQHGFLRYSPMDDCSDRYANCQHNRKQTHYHCVHEGCDKTYISTSDVQMHANYHRKDSAIIQEGFQRFRATEECLTPYCAFFGQRTTHFHCRRDNCQFTFKNKADMEKHKSYHIKDEQLSRDGFKKFMKNEACGFESCRFSRISNHIHCIRSNCSYVLHSSGQLLSHKRKHERKDSELAYRKFKLTQSVMKSLQEGVPINLEQFEAASLDHSQMSNGEYSSDGGQSSPPIVPPGFHRFGLPPNYLDPYNMIQPNLQAFQKMQLENFQKLQEIDALKYLSKSSSQDSHELLEKLPDIFKSPELLQKFPEFMLKSPELLQKLPDIMMRYPSTPNRLKTDEKRSSTHRSENDMGPMDLSNDSSKTTEDKQSKDEDIWTKYLRPYSSLEECADRSSCEDAGKDHFHCVTEGCRIVFRTKDAVKEHGRNHAEQDRITESSFFTATESPCRYETECDLRTKHYHCTWEGCREIVLPTDAPFLRLDHVRQHEASRIRSSQSSTATSLDAMFRRKRGRPPKNRVIEVWNDNVSQNSGSLHDSPQAIFTSFKLPKPSLGLSRPISGSPVVDLTQEGSGSPATERSRETSPIQLEGFYSSDGDNCSEISCRYNRQHFHCSYQRCVFSTDRPSYAVQHKEFHERVNILDNFVHFDRLSDCKAQACLHNKIAKHFHCTRMGCNFSFLRSSTMILHEGNHMRNGEGEVPLTRELEHEQAGEEESDSRQEHSISPDHNSSGKTTVKAAGTYYPLTSFQDDTTKQAGKISYHSTQQSPENLSQKKEENKIHPASPSKLFPSHNAILNPNAAVIDTDSQNPLSKLMKLQSEATRGMREIQKPEKDLSREVLPDYMTLDRHVRYGITENCSRPFCKLKRKEHFHCNACNQAFSEQEKLRQHIARHSSGAMSPGVKKEPEDNNNDDLEEIPSHINHPGLPNFELDHTANPFQHHFGGFPLPPSLNAAFAQQLNIMQNQSMMFQPSLYGGPAGLMFGPHGLHPHHPLANGLHPTMLDVEQAQAMHQHLTNLTLASSAGKRSMSPTPLADLSQEAKKARVQNSMRILKDEPVPDGYVRYRFNEDCKYPHCGYREHQTHFHCMRKDCGYSFCDKTRFVQHTARHERLDTLMGGDFQQYRANVSCNRADCVYASSLGTVQNKASHFHCIKCDFVCTDTNKVVAHRRQHQKLDSINAAGFEKYTPSQNCSTEGCSHSGKQTHYHCLSCQYAVLGLSQMSAHKYRHLE